MGVLGDVMTAAKALQEAGKIEQYEKLIRTHEQISEQIEKIEELKKENAKLKEKLEIQGALRFHPLENSFYMYDKSEKLIDGPFCSHCWDSDHLLIHLHGTTAMDYFLCPKCNNTAGKDTTRPRTIPHKTEDDERF